MLPALVSRACVDRVRLTAVLLQGLAQTGCWACLDEFNRISVEVLSVVAEQFLQFQTAVRSGKSTFEFLGCVTTLKPTAGLFVTMNPGYRGRASLPDNLAVLFRPAALVVPDYVEVGEVILYSLGFLEATTLARRTASLYKACAEQLSPREFYDFGMRSFRSVLVMAGQFRSESDDPEEQVVMRAITTANSPKLVASDLTIFHALLQDFFPGVALKPCFSLHGVEDACAALDLQPTHVLHQAVHFLAAALDARVGVMLLGPAGSGKTRVRDVLFKAWQTDAEGNPKTVAPEDTSVPQ